MIINIRGTSGSGKSTIMREIMKNYDCQPVHEPGRKQPIYYVCSHNDKMDNKVLIVLGHYESPCGGCDTIPKMDRIYELVREHANHGCDVLYEGLLISAEVNRCAALKEDGYDVRVVHLHIPLQVCIDSVNQRRWAKNPDKPGVNPKNTESKWKGTKRAMERLDEAGLECWQCTERSSALRLVGDMLNV